MGDRKRNIVGQIMLICCIFLIVAAVFVGRYEVEIMRHDITAIKVLLVVAALSFIAGILLLVSTKNPDNSDNT